MIEESGPNGMPDTDWIHNRLEVSGQDAALTDFIDRTQGPGFVPWRWSGGEDRDYWAAPRRWPPPGAWQATSQIVFGGH